MYKVDGLSTFVLLNHVTVDIIIKISIGSSTASYLEIPPVDDMSDMQNVVNSTSSGLIEPHNDSCMSYTYSNTAYWPTP